MAARKAYCGLEVLVNNPDGTQLTLYVADAFDDKCDEYPSPCNVSLVLTLFFVLSRWVLTPTSIDVMYNSVSLCILKISIGGIQEPS
jgi:hypothetical protein